MFRIVIGMSDELKNVRDKIRDAAGMMDMHLVKLALFPDCEAVNHWRSEVASFLWRVPKVKGSNKFPKVQLIMDGLSVFEDTVLEEIQHVTKKYKNLTPADINPIKLRNMIREYHLWLANELHSYGSVDLDEIEEKLKELGF